MQDLAFGIVHQVGFLAELECLVRAGVGAPGGKDDLAVHQVRAAGAFLGDAELRVEVDGIVGADIQALAAARALFRVYDDQPIRSRVESGNVGRTRLDAGSIRAVLTRRKDKRHLDVRHLTSDILGHLAPELPRLWLWFGIGCPVVSAVLVFASKLAAVASTAL